MRKWLVLLFVFLMGAGTAAIVTRATAEGAAPKPKYTIKEVMQLAHKKLKLHPKVLKGQATEKEKLKLMELYIALWENDPPKGKKADWQKRVGDLMNAVCKVALGYPGAEAELKAVANCGGCHKPHKG